MSSPIVVGELAGLLSLDANPFQKGLDRAMNNAERTTAQKMTSVGNKMSLALTVPITAAFFKMTSSASDLGETVSQTEQIFGSATSQIGTFAERAAKGLGQSERAAREAANTFGLFFTNAGKSQTEAADMSITLTKLASDMASFKNTSPEQAVQALGAALRGESEPIRAYGVMLDDATLKQRALNMGLIESTSDALPPAIKMQAAYAEILGQTTTIQGDFERTSGGLANKQRILAAELENTSAALGQKLLPFVIKGADAASFMVDTFANLPGPLQTAVVGMAALLAISGPLLSVGGRLASTWGTLSTRIATSASPQTAAAFTAITKGAAAAGIAVAGLSTAYALFQAAAQSQRDDVAAMFPEWERALDVQGASYEELKNRVANIRGEIERVDDIIRGSQAPWDADKRRGLKEGEEELLRLAGVGQAMIDRADELSTALGITSQEAVEMAQSQSVMSAAVSEATGELDTQKAATAANVEELTKFATALSALFDPLFGAQDATLALKAAQDKAANAAKEHGAKSAEAAEANRDLTRAALANEQAMVRLAAGIESNDVPLQDAIDTLNRWVEQGYITRQAADEQIWAFTVLADKAKAVPDEVGINVTATGIDGVITGIEMIQTAIGKVPKFVPIGFIGPTLPGQQRTPGPTYTPPPSQTPGQERLLVEGARASGGPVWPGAWLLGEDGPEIVQMGGAGHVYDAATTRRMLDAGGPMVGSTGRSGGGGSPIVVQTVVELDGRAIGSSRDVIEGLETVWARRDRNTGNL